MEHNFQFVNMADYMGSIAVDCLRAPEKRLSQCVYDNPNTMRRERYVKGEMTAFVTAAVICSKRPTPVPGLKNIQELPRIITEPWESGRVIGDSEAMNKQGI